MQEKTARLTILIDPENKLAFEAICASNEVTTSHMVRHLIQDYLRRHGIRTGETGGEVGRLTDDESNA